MMKCDFHKILINFTKFKSTKIKCKLILVSAFNKISDNNMNYNS